MDTILVTELLKSLTNGDMMGFAKYLGIFIFLWIEVRGLKNELKKLNTTVADSFKKGEDRFSKIEGRLTTLETPKQGE